MTKTYYHCEVYQYDAYGRNRIHEAFVEDVRAYATQLDVSLPEWDEIEVKTESDIFDKLLDNVDDSQFLGKLVNPRSKYIFLAKG
jgi:hypothetical protein